jgi:3-methyladenine DNA glycosylase AlkD
MNNNESPPPSQAPPALPDARAALREHASEADAHNLKRFFKTGPGQYAEGDQFIGVRVPAMRRIARNFDHLPLADVAQLLSSPVHEERFLALVLLVRRYRKTPALRDAIFRLYLDHARFVNNWDLVDVSAEHLVGSHLLNRPRSLLRKLAKSSLLWERRIAIIATFHFIRNGQFDDTLQIAELLLDDPEDLIHKAVGWMLREVGNRDRKTEEAFLLRHARRMPRTMLRYAIEKFPEPLRLRYLRAPRQNAF